MDEELNDIDIEAAIENQPEIIYEGDEGYEEPQAEIVAEAEEPEEIEEEEPKGKKPRIPAKTRINQMSRKVHEESRRAEKAEQELNKLREENERLQRLSESANKSVLNSQEGMIDSYIKSAEQIYAKAIEDGDVSGQIEASKAIAAAMAQKNRLDEIKFNQKAMDEERQYTETKQKAAPHQEEYQAQEPSPEAQEWVSSNPWFNENADDFDPDLHQKAFAYAQWLDRDYARKGKDDLIGTHYYFDDLDRYMSKHIKPIQPVSQESKGGLVMNRPKSNVAGVGRANPPGGQREIFRMSREEQEMSKAMGWTDQQWFENKKLADRLEKEGRLLTTNSRQR